MSRRETAEPLPETPSGRDGDRTAWSLREAGLPNARAAPIHAALPASDRSRRARGGQENALYRETSSPIRHASRDPASPRRWVSDQPQAGRASLAPGRAPGASEATQTPSPGKLRARLHALPTEIPEPHIWSYDFVADQTEDGRRLKTFVVMDEFSRRCLALEVGRRFTSEDVIDTMRVLFDLYGTPTHVRSDNGPELIATALRCWLWRRGTDTLFIEPGSPWENA